MSDTTSTKAKPEARARSAEVEAETPPATRGQTEPAAAAKPAEPAAVAKPAEESFHALEHLTKRVIEQSQAAIQLGVQSFARAHVPATENGFSQGRKAIEVAAQIADCYREAVERSANDVQMLGACSLALVRGGQTMQNVWLNAVRRSIDQMDNKPRLLINAHSPLEAAQLHRDLYNDMLSNMVQSATAMLQAVSETSQDALRSLQPRGRA